MTEIYRAYTAFCSDYCLTSGWTQEREEESFDTSRNSVSKVNFLNRDHEHEAFENCHYSGQPLVLSVSIKACKLEEAVILYLFL